MQAFKKNKEIIKKISGKDVAWYLNDYDSKKNSNYIKIIEGLGFKGKIEKFSCNLKLYSQ